MYLRQPCPHCGQEAEFVYVQIGHHVHCKKCNNEFELKPQGVKWGKYVIAVCILLFGVGVVFFVAKSFHDWWIYGNSKHKDEVTTKSTR